ncbi:leucine-rich repeat and WD repeat-containing protein 1 [Polypterus senegalus]|uniref:leucine-rich repeat and WD repeat-containing protein 1 n=1 Tax=Polypterus senegalus TaxID=55291 RepID=UPI00196324E2|nr:leucine-rich repeat and WD repeat-containing protein 1 [Polypterus senegalus]XP_039612550.1 leucine-rich repeat and WD repeat-containing protein 1 [Polypterus senegalus]
MAKITEKLLRERGLPKGSKLKKVRCLNLSNLSLKNEDLDCSLLSQMQELEELDVSENLLTAFPLGLNLPCLRTLNCFNNQLEDVIALEQFHQLEELNLEDNLYLTVSDNYKAMYLLPKLKRLSGKDISSTANHIRHVNSEELSKRVTKLFEANFRCRLPDPPSTAAVRKLEAEFLKEAEKQVKYGPNSLSDYTKWRVNKIATELLASLINTAKSDDHFSREVMDESHSKEAVNNTRSKEGRLVQSPGKRKASNCNQKESNKKMRSDVDDTRTSLSPKRMPSKSLLRSSDSSSIDSIKISKEVNPLHQSLEEATEMQENTKGSKDQGSSNTADSDLLHSPQKNKQVLKNKMSVEKDVGSLKPQKRKGKGTPMKEQEESKMEDINGTWCENTKDSITWEPIHFLQCHSNMNSPKDLKTQLWACAFEPVLDTPSKTVLNGTSSQTVATCGGDSVCIIDCETGTVLKKYKVPSEGFFTVAWTTLTMVTKNGKRRLLNVLAAAGTRGIVKLIHPRANLAYGEFKASKKPVSALVFSPVQEAFLFTATYEKKIILWDIGGLGEEYDFRVSKLLTLETKSIPLHVKLVPSQPEHLLLAACEEGMFVFDIDLNKNKSKRPAEWEVLFPVYNQEDEDGYNDFRLIDGLSFLSDNIVVSKSAKQGSIYLWSWKQTLAAQQKTKNKKLEAVILAELQWCDTDITHLSLGTCPDKDYVACGDDKGAVWTYDLELFLQTRAKATKKIAPSQVLEWPAPNQNGKGPLEPMSINNVGMDPELHYLVALTDKNIVVIWKRMQQQ